MLLNFCDASLRTDVTCSTVSTEGYEVTNLVNNSDKGFLAYACIKPPIKIDFVFICNIQISHVIIYPQVGAQKSCGFQLSVRSSDTNNQPFVDVSTGFIKKEESGVFFYRRDVSHYTDISAPPNFVQRYIKALNSANYASSLRISILKTENSVPALGKVEIWGRVSSKCGKDVAMNVMALWMNRFNHLSALKTSSSHADNKKPQEDREPLHNNLLDVPEEFLDPITFEIMTQPIILPSGKVIDQKTLEKHGHNEAIWGRPVSDPFTGIRFDDVHKPIAALPLKARIDKFLLENSNDEEIKKLPRVLGSKTIQYSNKNVEIITCETRNYINSVNTVKTNINPLKRTLPVEASTTNIKKSFQGHSLPLISMRNSSSSNKSSTIRTPNSMTLTNKIVNKDEINKRNAEIEEKLNASVQVTSVPTCKCCINSIFYKLPCKHVICRKALLSLENSECSICKLQFKSSDPQRYHLFS